MSQLDEWVWATERLPALLDGEWLEAEVARVAAAVAADTSGGRRDRRTFHPLAELTYQVRRELQARQTPAFRPTPSIAKLGTLSFALQRLGERAVEGLDDRVSRLTGSSVNDGRKLTPFQRLKVDPPWVGSDDAG